MMAKMINENEYVICRPDFSCPLGNNIPPMQCSFCAQFISQLSPSWAIPKKHIQDLLENLRLAEKIWHIQNKHLDPKLSNQLEGINKNEM